MMFLLEAIPEEKTTLDIEGICRDLFREWQTDLTLEEKHLWLWNASVEMVRIKRRRKL